MVESEPTPRVPISSTKLNSFAGTYFNAGYGKGNLTLCSPTTPSPSLSAECKQVIEDFASFPSSAPELDDNSTLYASFRTLWSSHARLHYVGNDTFQIQITYLFPEGYGKDQTPFETYEDGEAGGTVRFAVRRGENSNGLGMTSMLGERTVDMEEEVLGFGLFDTVGAVTDREKKGGSVEETADVWFERVKG